MAGLLGSVIFKGSTVADQKSLRAVDFSRMHFSSDVFSLLCFVDFRGPIYDYPLKATYTSDRNIFSQMQLGE